MSNNFKIIGIMSGTSLDGVDIAHCTFKKNKNWTYKIDKAKTVEYPSRMKKKLKSCFELSGYKLIKLDHDLGEFIGLEINKFIKHNDLNPEIISSHGHTVFHNPKEKIGLQIGNANKILSIVKIPVINNFRELDIILGGQGAPLVPIGEKLLFKGYDYFINLGGIINITKIDSSSVEAYDVVASNLVLNNISNKLNFEFDNKGNIARKGKLISTLFDELNSLKFYKKNHPKSIGIEWINKKIFPIIYKSNHKLEDVMATFSNHIAYQLIKNIDGKKNKILVTGGGVYNDFLVEKIKVYDKNKNLWIIPDNKLIKYKEALIFAFMGLLKKLNKQNILNNVTGSNIKISAGNISKNIF